MRFGTSIKRAMREGKKVRKMRAIKSDQTRSQTSKRQGKERKLQCAF
jgi:hypothetical protein